MAKKHILDNIKPFINYFYKDEEFISEEELNKLDIRYSDRKACFECKDIMLKLLKLLLDGNIVSNYTIIWLKSSVSSVNGALDFYNSQVTELERINIGTGTQNIRYDKEKLEKKHGIDSDWIYRINVDPERFYEPAVIKLDMLYRYYMKDKDYTSNLIVKLPKDIINKTIDETGWERLKSCLNTYSKIRAEIIKSGDDSNFSIELIGYFNYIISSKSLSDQEKDRLKTIKDILGIKT